MECLTSKKRAPASLRTFHRILGLLLFLFVINAAATGVLRANAKKLYWKERVSHEKRISMSIPAVSIKQIFELCNHRFKISRIELKSFLGKSAYLVSGEKKQRVLIDGETAELLSPLSKEMAIRVAQGYVEEDKKVISVINLPNYKVRKSVEVYPVYKITFDDNRKTEVIVDQESGNVIMVLDNGRRFGMWVSRLHELDFAGWSDISLTFIGISIIVLSMTGFVMGIKLKSKSA